MTASGGNRVRRSLFWGVFVLVCAAFGLGLVVTVSQFPDRATVDTTTMENTLRPGDLLFYLPPSHLRRGDIVLERVPVSGPVSRSTPGSVSGSVPRRPPAILVRRVIGLPGDRVACCQDGGRISVNGKALDERYLYPGSQPSAIPFAVTLKSGQYWLLGDNRSVAVDSRDRGPVPRADVAGRVVAMLRGGSVTIERTPGTFVADGLAPVDTRRAFPLSWMLLTGVATLVLLGFGIFGIGRAFRRSVRPGAQPDPGEPGPDEPGPGEPGPGQPGPGRPAA